MGRVFPALILVFAACFSACETSPQSLYYWGNYESQVYAYLNGDSRGAQIQAMERDLEKAAANSRVVPPGFFAHLGLLYAETGNDADAAACFEAEKAFFPEAASYMDLLLRNMGK